MSQMHPLSESDEALLSDDEIDELDEFLISQSKLENSMDISTLDGFFAALVLNPEATMPSEYLPWIWDMEEGEHAPDFASPEQARHILQLIMRYYNGVLVTIGSGSFAPLLYTVENDDDGEFFDAEGWCMGFMQGVFLFFDPWKNVFEKSPEFLAPMVLLGTQQGWEMLDKCGDEKQAIQDACNSIAEAVSALYSHFREPHDVAMQGRLTRHGGQSELLDDDEGEFSMPRKTFRNVACPCGSGKVFEDCCGSPPILH